MNLADLRRRIPELEGLDDESAVDAVQQAYYPDIDRSQIAERLGVKFAAPAPPPAPRRSLMAVANDTVIEAGNAVAGAVGSVGNFISPGNRVSEFIDENIIQPGEASQSDAVQQSRKQFQDEVEAADGIGGELMAVGRKVLRDPLLTAAQAAGSFAVPGFAVKGGNAAAAALGAGARGVARGGLAGGAVAGAALSGGDAAGTAYDLVIKAGGTEEEATAAARQASVLPAVVGGAGGLVGAERLLSGAGGMKGGLMARALKTAGVEGLQEGFEEGITQYEGQRAAMPFDPSIDPMKGTAAAAGMGAVMGGAIGAGTGMLARNHPEVATKRLADADNVADMIAAAEDLAMAPLEPVAPVRPRAAAADIIAEVRQLDPAQQSEAMGLMATANNMQAPGNVRRFAQNRLDELLRPFREIPVGEATEMLPVGEATEVVPASENEQRAADTLARWMAKAEPVDEARANSMVAAATDLGKGDFTVVPHPAGGFTVVPKAWMPEGMAERLMAERRASEWEGGQIPAGEASDLIPTGDVIEGEQRKPRRIPTGEATEIDAETVDPVDSPDVPSSNRRRTDAVDLDLSGRVSVKAYVDRQRQTNTPAARAFVRDFDAGRITPADVMALIPGPKKSAMDTANERLAAAAKQAPTIQPDDLSGLILTGDGQPYGTRSAAVVRAKREDGTVVSVPGGWAVRPNRSDVHAATLQGLPNSRSADAGTFSDLAQSQAFKQKGLGGIDVPGQRVVLGAVLRSLDNDQVVDRVVERIPINVMDMLFGKQGPSKRTLDNRSVLKNALAARNENPVSADINVAADAVVRAVAGVAAELGSSVADVSAVAQKRRATVDAGKRSVGGEVATAAGLRAEQPPGLRPANLAWEAKNGDSAARTLDGRQVNSPTRVDELGPSSGATAEGPTTVSKNSISGGGNEPVTNLAGTAVGPAGASDGRGGDAGRSSGDVRPVPAAGTGGAGGSAVAPGGSSGTAAPVGAAGGPDAALSDDIPTLKMQWAEAVRANDNARAKRINDRIVALKNAPSQSAEQPPAKPVAESQAPDTAQALETGDGGVAPTQEWHGAAPKVMNVPTGDGSPWPYPTALKGMKPELARGQRLIVDHMNGEFGREELLDKLAPLGLLEGEIRSISNRLGGLTDGETARATGQAKPAAPLKTRVDAKRKDAAAADGKSRAVTGGQDGVNGYFYKGGQFLPSTTAAPGKWKVKGKWVNAGTEEVEPGVRSAQPTPFSRSIYSLIGGWLSPLKNGKAELYAGAGGRGIRDSTGAPITLESEIRPGVKGVLGKEALTVGELIDAYNAGQRWFDVQPDAETVTTKDAASQADQTVPAQARVPEAAAPEAPAAEKPAVAGNAQESAPAVERETPAPPTVKESLTAAKPKRPPKSFRKKVKVQTQVFVEETASFESREIDADSALKALDEDVSELERFMACLKD